MICVCVLACLAVVQVGSMGSKPSRAAPPADLAAYRPRLDADQYDLKAAFLFNFTRYTRWPADAFKDADAPIVIAIVGGDPFGARLEKVFRGKKIGKRSIVIERYATAKEIGTVHVLVLGRLDKKERKRCIAKVNKKPVLTVADKHGVTSTGAMVGFYMDDKRIRFEIAPARVKAARLKMRSQLFKLARIVRTKK